MYYLIKRLIDLVVSFLALVVLLPVLLPICLILLLTGEHYIFYFQKRIGSGLKTFDIWKFATMLKNSPNVGTGTITLRKDPRVLPFGTFLRKTKINELPQIVNVLIGNMSLVGPRPLTENQFMFYSEKVRDDISLLKPGITGIGSIVFRDEEKIISDSKFDPKECYKLQIAPFKGALEQWYLANRSLYTDMVLIFLTAWVIISPESNLHFRLLKDLPEKPNFI
jgi:lipopolysaccharide/colanic/teichoic acid biosynthesis glycosyltransferase